MWDGEQSEVLARGIAAAPGGSRHASPCRPNHRLRPHEGRRPAFRPHRPQLPGSRTQSASGSFTASTLRRRPSPLDRGHVGERRRTNAASSALTHPLSGAARCPQPACRYQRLRQHWDSGPRTPRGSRWRDDLRTANRRSSRAPAAVARLRLSAPSHRPRRAWPRSRSRSAPDPASRCSAAPSGRRRTWSSPSATLLGHSQTLTTMAIYGHVMPALAGDAADRMGAHSPGETEWS